MLLAKPAIVREKALLFTINKLYRSDMSPEELYEATRGVWLLGEDREEAELGLAVYQGIVREVYRIERWVPACTLVYSTRDDVDQYRGSGRWEFEGHVATEVRDDYVDFSVGKGGQNPVRYVNIK